VLARFLTAASVLCVSLLPAAARAAPPTSSQPEAATIVLVGEYAGMPELAATLVELLERQNVEAHVVRSLRFQPGQVISGGEKDQNAWAFVVLEPPALARLYFRGPHAERYLLRNLPLRDGLDEYGRELIAQVVESSVSALLHSTAGITREQASAEIDRPLEVPRTEPVSAAPQTPPAAQKPSEWRAWTALRYAFEWSGGDLGAAHGPGLEVGVEWSALRTRLIAERAFAQTLASPELTASLQTTALRFAVDTYWPKLAAHALVIGLGAGIDILDARPTAASDPLLTLAPGHSHAVPVVRAEVGYQLHQGPWRLLAFGFVDASLLHTHYDLDRAGSEVRLATPWPMRPGAGLVFGWSPSIGGP
jgi:hypothetical protein